MKIESIESVSKIEKIFPDAGLKANSVSKSESSKTFKDYLLSAMSQMNDQQIKVSNLGEQLITDPDSVDVHDVMISVAKAKSSLNLAQTVIDRLLKGWSEITTTR